MKFSELVRVLERNGFKIDYHAAKEIPTGTCDAILKAAGLKPKGRK